MTSDEPAAALTSAPAGQDWTSRFMRAGDEERVLALLKRAFKDWPRVDVSVSPLEHLKWKLDSRPEARRYSTVAETSDGRIVGLQLLFVQRVKVSEQTLLVIQGVDLCVDPDFQKRGVMADMRRFAWPTYYRVFDMRMGQTERVALHKLARREGSVRIANAVDILVRRGGDEPETADGRGWEIVTVPRFDERIDELWREASRQFRLILVRSSDYLNWRYDPRGGAFTIKLAQEDGRVLGYTVLTTAGGKGQIADLLTRPGRTDVAISLVREALVHFGRAGVAKSECWLPTHHPYRGALEGLGFRETKRTLHLTYGAFRMAEADLAFLSEADAAFHYASGDLDLV